LLGNKHAPTIIWMKISCISHKWWSVNPWDLDW